MKNADYGKCASQNMQWTAEGMVHETGSYLMFIIFCLLISVVDLGPIKDRDGAFAPLMYGTY